MQKTQLSKAKQTQAHKGCAVEYGCSDENFQETKIVIVNEAPEQDHLVNHL